MDTVRVVVCVAVLCAAFVPALAVASDGTAADGRDAAVGGEAATAPAEAQANAQVEAQEEPTPAGNDTTTSTSTATTVQHRDPDARNRDGDLQQVQSWLVGQLAGRLSGSTVQLSQGQYEQARRVLGDDYDADLAKLVDVAGETDATRSFRQASEHQRDLADAAGEYDRTLAEYREARRNGETQRARQLGRELERLSGQVDRNATDAIEGYDGLEESTGREFSEERGAVAAVNKNVSKTQAEIRDDLFVETTISASADGERVSFTAPLAVEGRVAMENGTAVADREVAIRVGHRTYIVRTDADGAFSLAYRPTRARTDASSVPVGYVPAVDSPFLASNTSVPVAVEPVEPTVTASASPASVAFGDTVRVSGRVEADGVGAPGVPVRVVVGDVPVARTTTGPDGRYSGSPSLPAGVPVGTQSVTVEVAQDGRAIGPASGSTTVEVVETATELSMTASPAGQDAVRVTGQLRTADGTSLPNRSVAVAVPGAGVRTVETGAEGRFATTVATDRTGELAVNASFAGQGTNLGPSSAVETVTLAGAGTGSTGPDDVHPLVFVAVGLLAAVLLALLAARGGLPFGADEQAEPTVAADAGGVASTGPEESGDAAASLLSTARWELAAGRTNESVVTAYAAARSALADRRTDRSLTHWEFLQRHDDRLDDTERSALEQLTSTYERAAFAMSTLSDAVAETALETAERVTGESSDPSDGTSDGTDHRSGSDD